MYRSLRTVFIGLASSGCVLGAAGAQPLAIAEPMQSSKDHACEMMAHHAAPVCTDTSIQSVSYAMAGDEAARSVEAARARCAASVAGQARATELEACIVRIRAGTDAERARQQQRLPAERAKVPTVQADPGFAALAEEYRALDHDALVASDNLRIAREERNPNVHRYQAHSEEANARRREARGRINRLYDAHAIDPRDAPLLGLP